ncbi:hypothetical protein [Persephonella sp.]|uniref:hypothetical protein n=1 Tax=Persephonella sp. TaxID=2060922 RepID=UPI0025E59DD7|nr:hypothetical protein [Persephonella sp.]
MRYTVQHRKSRYINFLVINLSFGIQFFMILFVLYKYLMEELFPEQIKLSILGDPDQFLEGKSLLQIVESVHIEVFLIMLTALTVMSILLRVEIPEKFKVFFIFTGFISGFVYAVSPFLVSFWGETFSYVQFLSFCSFIITCSAVNTLNIYCFLTGKIK